MPTWDAGGFFMDFATGVGFLVGIAVVLTLVFLGGDLRMFYDVHALIVIGGGVLAATMIRFPFSGIAHGLPLGFKFAFSMRSSHPRELIEELTQIAEVVRKNGPMALESVQVDDSFLAQGIRYVADGYDKEFIKDTMERDRDIFLHLSDPSKLGPLMAIALLATLYGALVGNLFCLPIADKLHVKLDEENVSRSLIIDGILLIRESKSPSLVKEMLIAYLPEHHRAEFAEAA
jgi:chemotaxis protein MotA